MSNPVLEDRMSEPKEDLPSVTYEKIVSNQTSIGIL